MQPDVCSSSSSLNLSTLLLDESAAARKRTLNLSHSTLPFARDNHQGNSRVSMPAKPQPPHTQVRTHAHTVPQKAVKHLHNVETRSYCPDQTFLKSKFQCRDDDSEFKYTFRD